MAKAQLIVLAHGWKPAGFQQKGADKGRYKGRAVNALAGGI